VRGMCKNKGEPHVAQKHNRKFAGGEEGSLYAAWKHRRRRNRRILVAVLLACILLVFADYLINDGELLRGVRLSGSEVSEEQEQPVVSDQEVVEEGGAAGEGEAAEEPTPTVLLGEFFTDYAWDPDPGRQSNLRMASEAIDGTLLAPGEEFSALNALEGLDYQAAKVFANGGIDYTEGGGLCQVSSTVYMAANYAGLDIVERNPHYAELGYIRPGLDATVWFGENGWGALDMRFKNNTNGYILVREFVNEEGFLVAQIYGEEPTGRVVSMDSERVEVNPNKGIKWATYKKVTDNGKVVQDGLLFETTYSYNPPTPPELKHETNEVRGSGWVDTSNTTNWNEND
jgi:vancomycin resistance protein YoaR